MARVYTKTVWNNETLSGDELFNIVQGVENLFELVGFELATSVVQEGTAISAAIMNNIEDAIEEIYAFMNEVEFQAEVVLNIVPKATTLTVGDDKGDYDFVVPLSLDGWKLISAHAAVDTVSTSGTPTFQIYNRDEAVDMLSTRITIDINEQTSLTAAVPPVVHATNNIVNVADRIRVDCDVAGTGTKGLVITLKFEDVS